jgi:hypothetical protein
MEDVDMFSEMRNCMSRMPWEELDVIGNGLDFSWFNLGVRENVGSIPAIQALVNQPPARPSNSLPPTILPTSGRRDPQISELVPDDSSANISLQGEERDPSDAMDVDTTTRPQASSEIRIGERNVPVTSPTLGGSSTQTSEPGDLSDANAMNVDKEDSTTDPRTSSRRRIAERNLHSSQTRKLGSKGSQLKTSVKGKKRAMMESEEESEEDYDDEEEEEEPVCSLTQTQS